MSLFLDQLVYTSFPIVGFRTLVSGRVPTQIQQAFVQQVVYQHWNPYNPPALGYRAAYLHQVTPEDNLFGWLYNDGLDDLGRGHVPYFVCYYLAEQLHAVQLENIFTCLQRGPVELIDRQSLPADLETIVAPDLWCYQSAYKGVTVSSDIRERSHLVLNQKRLINLFVPVDEREIVTKSNGQIHDQQETAPSVRTRRSAAEGIETSLGDVEQEYQRRLQLYEQVLVDAVQQRYPLGDRTRTRLKLLQQASGLKDEDVAFTEAQVLQRRAAIQSTDDNISRVMEEQRTSRPKAVTPIKLLNKKVAASKPETFVLAETKLPVIPFASRGLLIWGLVAVATIIAIAISVVSPKSRQILTSPLSNLQPFPSTGSTPLEPINESAKLERSQPQYSLGKEEQKDNQKRSTSAQVSESILGFPTGTSESIVVRALGKPTQTSIGYWPNTYTIRYDLVPNQITVAYLFDGDSKRIRQTEASFSQSVDSQVMQATLNGMLDGKVTREIQQGLRQIRQYQSSRYSFAMGPLKGIIERRTGDSPRSTLRDRIYIGIWDMDLHQTF